MKKGIFGILFILIVGLMSGYSQLIHSKGDRSLVLGVNYLPNGLNALVNYSHLISNDIIIKGSLMYEKKEMRFSKLNIIALESDVLYSFYRIGNSIFFNAGIGMYCGLEMSNNDIFNPYRRITLGESVLVSADYYISPKIVLGIILKQRVVHLSEVGMFSWYAGLGVGYNL